MKLFTFLATLLVAFAAQAVNLTISDPITGNTLCYMPRPQSDRMQITADTNLGLQGLWFVLDGAEASGLRLSLVGSNARNLIVDATGSDVSGAQFFLDGTDSTHVRFQAYDAQVNGLVYAINRGTSPSTPLVPVLEGWPTQQSPAITTWAPVVKASEAAFNRGQNMGVPKEVIAEQIAILIRTLY